MFERFTCQARRVVVLAQEDARARAAEWIGPDNLLACLCSRSARRRGSMSALHGVAPVSVRVAPWDDPGALVAGVLSDVGIAQADVESELADAGGAGPDRAALAAFGIDLDEVRRRVDQSFGPGALDRAAARQLAGRRRRRRSRHLPFTHEAKRALQLALREAVRLGDHPGVDGIGSRLMAARGRTLDDVRTALGWRTRDAEGV